MLNCFLSLFVSAEVSNAYANVLSINEYYLFIIFYFYISRDP
jgi:hypothetical protein